MSERIPNEKLLAAGLDLAAQNGKLLTKLDSFGGSMRYKTADGKIVRVRTCNDHILIVVADKPSSDAKLNIEGTDYLLIVMPEIQRTPGKVRAYLIPTEVAVKASRRSHQAWLDSNPNTNGANKTFCLWFRKNGKTKLSSDYETKWAEYRLAGEASTEIASNGGSAGGSTPVSGSTDGSVKAEVEMARQRISKAAGVAPDAVKITIQFGL
jgi:hypothetical protein